ncbi:erythroid differentiation-related factor 1 [Ostrinia nubilalis]|uniref:erythroid differentiation-related factor 1 n=1 Tax=Ostrinia nubilalis TaxID=29057 RepID=UPI0030823042
MEEVEKDNENDFKRSKDRSPSPGVKSTAVVKYTAFQSPVGYARLQCNTDLNLPPSNWGAAIDSYGLKQILTGNTGLSSFRMAHMFPDCVGEVDVISGAECIKKLLKLPYQPNGTVSMIVHRIENTLLLDDFDVYDYLMKSEWSWLKDFFYENVLKTMSEQERMTLTLAPVAPSSALQLTHKFLSHSVASRPPPAQAPALAPVALTAPSSLQLTHKFLSHSVASRPPPAQAPALAPVALTAPSSLQLTHKFLSHSVASRPPPAQAPALAPVALTVTSDRRDVTLAPVAPSSALQLTHKFLSHSVASRPPPAQAPALAPVALTGPYLPEPEPARDEAPPDHLYNRNVHWTFEDIHMLIGSDLPIFGDKDRPCVSLRLRDAREPINVLTGIDYWLDNLMCNVPEVLMCYHLDGIVQKYEPMKTEELPNMENSKFSPKVIRNVAQNILSFLKSNATKAGHTYWLFKGPHDDVVKLYDLTSLCPDSVDSPFTSPVGMLLYRVARNMRLANRSEHVRQLLEHAIELLKAEKYPQIVASSHYMLADLYVPANTNPACPDFKEETIDPDSEDPEFAKYAEPCDDDSEFDRDGKSKTDECDKDGNKESEKDTAEKEGDSTNTLAVQSRGLALRDIGNRVRESTGENKRKASMSGGLGTAPPDRCGGALKHALKGLLALHNVTIDKCKEEERERLRQQIIIEEQHPKMANPYEPIKMDYEPITKKSESKEHTSRSRRRRRERKTSDKTGNCLIESNSNIDKNAILIRNKKKIFPTWHEPSRDDNFAWKLHLKTLLYEKICLAYATLAEYSYSNEQYGFSLKYIDMASKCQKLLSNMIIKSRVVDASCLIGRVGDNYFQLSKNWHRLEQFRAQFDTDHELDARLRLEIESDMAEEVDGSVEDEFDLASPQISSSLISPLVSFRLRSSPIIFSKNWHRLEQFRAQFDTDHELDARLRLEIESDMAEEVDGSVEDEFDLVSPQISSSLVSSPLVSFRLRSSPIIFSKNWHRLEQFRAQFDTDHELDARLRLEIESDMAEEVDGSVEDEFDLDLTWPANETEAMLSSCSFYRRGIEAAGDKRSELLRRLASVNNELAVRYMNTAQQIYVKYAEEPDLKADKAKALLKQFASLSRKSAQCLDEATSLFERVNDAPNLALLLCNKARYHRFRAHCSQGDFGLVTLTSKSAQCLNEATALFERVNDAPNLALLLCNKARYHRFRAHCSQGDFGVICPSKGPVSTKAKRCGAEQRRAEQCGDVSGPRAALVWDLVAWELSCHLYTRAGLMQDEPERAPEVSEVADALKHALKHCLLGAGPRQYLYQFRAAMIHHRLGSLYHSQYRITSEDGPKRRTLLNATRHNYAAAANMFATLEDAAMFLTVTMEHVAALETQAQVTPNLKLKSLQNAVQLLRQCHSIMKVITDRDPEDQKDQPKPEDGDEKTMKNEHSLLGLFENRLHFILKSIIQYCRSKSNKDYEKMTDMYKKLYSASLRIKKDDDVRIYAGSVCEVLIAMDQIEKEFE